MKVNKNITREEAIELAGMETVEILDRENCEPTGLVGYNGACQGDDLTQWTASVKFEQDGQQYTLVAYYYTTNAQDDIMAANDGDGASIDWVIDAYMIVD